ncbi:MAG: ABC transporter ATP-binding protein [Bradymonadia bacterium]
MNSPTTRKNLLLPDITRWPDSEPVIELENVTKRYDGETIIDGLNLKIGTGKTTVIVGESGSGKSVLLRMMNGLVIPDSGKVRLFGEDLARSSETARTELRKRCTMVFQSYALIDSMDVFANIAFPLRENTRMKAPEIAKLVDDLLEMLELPHARHRMPSELSGGMKKRVSLARAVITNPEVVLFDEPTTGLDPVMIEFVDNLIIRTQREYKITSVIISHDMASNQRLADQMAMLSGGKIITEGTFDEVASSDLPAVKAFMANISTERLTRGEAAHTDEAPEVERIEGLPDASSVSEDISTVDVVPDLEGGPIVPVPRSIGGEPVVVVEGLHKSFGTNKVLKGITLEFPKQKISVVIGGSGSGKSVLIKHIIGLFQPTAGTVDVFGQRLNGLSGQEMQKVQARIGLLFQSAALFDSMTVRDNIGFPLAERLRWKKKAVKERVEEVAEQLKVKDILDRYPAAVSNGERKRVGLARAIVTKPEIMIYDEPTTGQDPIMMKRVDDMIVEAAETFNITSIVISHDMPSTFRIADQISMIYKGHLVAVGTPEALQDHPDPRVQEFIFAGSDRPEE